MTNDERKRDKKIIIVLIISIIFILFFILFYLNSKTKLTKSEKEHFEKMKIEKIEKEKQRKINEEKEKKKDEMILKYPIVDRFGNILMADFKISKKEFLRDLENEDSEEKLKIIKIYQKIFEDGKFNLNFKSIKITDDDFTDKKIVSLYLEGEYVFKTEISSLILKNILEQASFQFEDVVVLKIFINNKILNICSDDFRDSFKNICNDKKIKYFISKKKDSNIKVIFNVENGDILEWNNIEVNGVVYKESKEFLPINKEIGEVRVYNSDNVFLGAISLKNISNSNEILNNHRVIEKFEYDSKIVNNNSITNNFLDEESENSNNASDINLNNIKYVDSIYIQGKGKVANPRMNDGYILISSNDDTIDNKKVYRKEIMFK